MRLLFILLTSSCLSACALTPREKTLSLMATGVALGAVYGASRAEMKRENAFIFGGSLGVLAAGFGLTVFNEDREIQDLKAQNGILRVELERKSKGKILAEQPATFSAKIPKQYLPLVRPGSWKILEIDQWVEDGENRLIHQDKIMELVPPSLAP